MNKDIFAYSATETGYNHIKNGRICEDASFFYDDERMHICVVADGHGSDNYPRTNRGSRFAVNAALNCIKEFVHNADPKAVIDDEQNGFPLLIQLAKAVLNEWYLAVEDDYTRDPIGEEELSRVSEKYRKRYFSEDQVTRQIEKAYGSTLIAFTVTQEYSFGIQIGDGRCIVVDRYGNFTEPIPWDDNCQLNVTTSICDGNAIEEFRFCVSSQFPTAVFCGSDGIDDSYSDSDELYALYRSVLKVFIEHGRDTGQNEIKDYLPVLTKKGSGDDVSIGLIIDLKQAEKIAPLLELQAEIFKTMTDITKNKNRLVIVAEKRKSLYSRLEKCYVLNKCLSDTAGSIDQLTKEIECLNQEIIHLEQKLDSLLSQEQELELDVQVASFEEKEIDEEASNDHAERDSEEQDNKDNSSEMTESESVEFPEIVHVLPEKTVNEDQPEAMTEERAVTLVEDTALEAVMDSYPASSEHSEYEIITPDMGECFLSAEQERPAEMEETFKYDVCMDSESDSVTVSQSAESISSDAGLCPADKNREDT